VSEGIDGDLVTLWRETLAENKRLREALEIISGTGPPDWAIPKWNGETMATWAIARNALCTELGIESKDGIES
jgi:hypothetical protein